MTFEHDASPKDGSRGDLSPRDDIVGRRVAADRLDALADVADLMGDAEGAAQYRERAAAVRMAAMRLLDD